MASQIPYQCEGLRSLTVVIPTFNGQAYLQQAIESIWSQTRRADEIIIVDDCSTDATSNLARRLIPESPMPMRLLELSRNSGGPARPINVGVGEARSELIVVLDQDDVFTPTRLEDHCRYFADPNVALVLSCCGRLDGSRRQDDVVVAAILASGKPVRDGVQLGGLHLLHRILLDGGQVYVGYPAMTFRKSHWTRRGGVDESLRIASDFDYLCWLSRQGDAVFLPHVHYLRREHETNLCHDRLRMKREVFEVRTRHVPYCAPLRSGPDRDRLRGEYRAWAYWMRKNGHYRHGAALMKMSMQLWGADAYSLRELAKIVPDMLVSKLVRRPIA